MNKKIYRIISYNLHSGVGMDQRIDYDRMAEMLRSQKPDLIGFQEVAVNYPRSEKVEDPLVCMGKALNMSSVFGETCKPVIDGKQYRYGIGIMGSLPMEKVDQIPLPCMKDAEPRTALVVRVNTDDDRNFYLICTHLSHEQTGECEKIRQEQLRTISDRIHEKNYTPAVLVGDFNALPDTPCIRDLQKEWQVTDLQEPTFPADVPEIKIDYIAFYPDNAFTLKGYHVLAETVISDHRPIIAELEF
ncbi:MAG: endonuclease/exonuclease/phosphatase family protein [Lentisphaeria bacterium]|nr:endonuclease/exonuclease/phosphatase family protein [Lentisphaeria bacterium]